VQVGEVQAAFAPDAMRAAAGGLGDIVVWDLHEADLARRSAFL
jgi:hypothetical protein